ncbi:FAD/NAD(P)-binding protein [Allorhizobium undicola]|uniref:FAD/NAD(P)-binding protein n=1 Tax=Allorhizobium undicola TaxID=78527 RepID=UPI000686A07D|nr:FAD/NAD(P)-binding protein [Allorhizobium undicola]
MLDYDAVRTRFGIREGMMTAPGRCQVAVIGGGFTGASLARLLALKSGMTGCVAVFEPRPELGRGLAYDCADDALRLNVASHRMRALPGAPDAFHNWLIRTGRLESDPAGRAADGAFYARRGDFGRFMSEEMQSLVQTGLVRHVRERVQNLARDGRGWLLHGDQGSVIHADEVVIATTHPDPRTPQALAGALEGHPRFLGAGDSWHRLDAASPQDRILVLGAGLTALDAIASLRSRGHKGEIVLLSRSGRLPQTQALGTLPAYGTFTDPRPATALALLREVREAIADATGEGLPWQSVFDSLRQQGQALWQALSEPEQQRFMRHLKRRFETHRYRMPPQISALLSHEMRHGGVRNLAGQICRVERSTNAIHVDIITRPQGMVERQSVQWVMIATGPDYGGLIGSQPYLQSLADARLIRPDIHGMGLDVDQHCRALRRNGLPVDNLFVAGPLTRGRFGELTGAPEIAAQVETLAGHLAARLATAARIDV